MRTLAAVVGVVLLVPAAAVAQSPDDSGFIGRLVRDIASDYKNFPSLENAETLGVGGFAAIAVHAADQPISDWVTQSELSTLPAGFEYGSQLLQVPLAAAWWAIAAAAG